MKKIILILLISLSMLNAYELYNVKCIKGYTYLVLRTGNGIAMVQMFEADPRRERSIPQPVKCK